MVKIVVSPEVAAQIRKYPQPIQLVDELGNPVGVSPPPVTQEQIEEARSRTYKGIPGRTTQEILGDLRKIAPE